LIFKPGGIEGKPPVSQNLSAAGAGRFKRETVAKGAYYPFFNGVETV
jgi:hypothetical protein